MSRVGVKVTQPSDDVRKELRAAYDHDTAQLIATSQVIAINFQTVAAAVRLNRKAKAPDKIGGTATTAVIASAMCDVQPLLTNMTGSAKAQR